MCKAPYVDNNLGKYGEILINNSFTVAVINELCRKPI